MNKKEIAIQLRLTGKSYNEIVRIIKVSKGTLSYWFKGNKQLEKIKKDNISRAKKQWAKNITKYNKKRSKLCRLAWKKEQARARRDIISINNKELLLLGTALYWAEGYKRGNWSVIFCNSDPDINKIMMRYFVKICKIPKNKIRIQIHLHDDNKYQQAINYWSKIIHLPKIQFQKPMLLKSKASKGKMPHRLPHGTLRIRINDVELLNKIKGWISALIEYGV
jgi:hypothetical protein